MREGSRREKQREEKEREKGVWRREREDESNNNKSWSSQVGLTIFNIFTKMPLSNVI